ncbi:MAG: hypothetical protein Q9162_000269 [Coniocarpon cinnabarinum]
MAPKKKPTAKTTTKRTQPATSSATVPQPASDAADDEPTAATTQTGRPQRDRKPPRKFGFEGNAQLPPEPRQGQAPKSGPTKTAKVTKATTIKKKPGRPLKQPSGQPSPPKARGSAGQDDASDDEETWDADDVAPETSNQRVKGKGRATADDDVERSGGIQAGPETSNQRVKGNGRATADDDAERSGEIQAAAPTQERSASSLRSPQPQQEQGQPRSGSARSSRQPPGQARPELSESTRQPSRQARSGSARSSAQRANASSKEPSEPPIPAAGRARKRGASHQQQQEDNGSSDHDAPTASKRRKVRPDRSAPRTSPGASDVDDYDSEELDEPITHWRHMPDPNAPFEPRLKPVKESRYTEKDGSRLPDINGLRRPGSPGGIEAQRRSFFVACASYLDPAQTETWKASNGEQETNSRRQKTFGREPPRWEPKLVHLGAIDPKFHSLWAFQFPRRIPQKPPNRNRIPAGSSEDIHAQRRTNAVTDSRDYDGEELPASMEGLHRFVFSLTPNHDTIDDMTAPFVSPRPSPRVESPEPIPSTSPEDAPPPDFNNPEEDIGSPDYGPSSRQTPPEERGRTLASIEVPFPGPQGAEVRPVVVQPVITGLQPTHSGISRAEPAEPEGEEEEEEPYTTPPNPPSYSVGSTDYSGYSTNDSRRWRGRPRLRPMSPERDAQPRLASGIRPSRVLAQWGATMQGTAQAALDESGDEGITRSADVGTNRGLTKSADMENTRGIRMGIKEGTDENPAMDVDGIAGKGIGKGVSDAGIGKAVRRGFKQGVGTATGRRPH